MADTLEVTYIHDQMRGAPILSGTAGALIVLLDAFLVTGWGTVTATSVSVSAGIATATLPSNSLFEAGAVILVAGAVPVQLNGRARVLPGASSTQVQWSTAAADGDATGTITIKYAPQGSWEKTFSGANKAVYRSLDAASTQMFLRVNDANTTYALVRGYETMSDVDTGTGPFPTLAQYSGDGGYWHKSSLDGVTATKYILAADTRLMLVAISPGTASNSAWHGACVRGFGDMARIGGATDGYHCAISVTSAPSWLNNNSISGGFDAPAISTFGTYLPRSRDDTTTALLCPSRPICGDQSPSVTSGADSTLGALSDAVDGQLQLSARYLALSTTNNAPRVYVPGVYTCPQTGALAAFPRASVVDGSDILSGHRLIAVSHSSWLGNYQAVPNGVSFVDITGPWR